MAEVNGINGPEKSDRAIVFGLLNAQGKYLTAEKFGNQISVTGTSLRQKQMWTFVQDEEGGSKGYLRSPQNKYLETDKLGNVVCESDEREKRYAFDVAVTDDGKWTFRDVFGKYFAGTTDRLYTTSDQKPNGDCYWSIHLAAHPQVNMKSVSRKRYVQRHDDPEELRCNSDIPWGHDAVMTLEFSNGLYRIRCSTGILNGVSGDIVTEISDECMFVLSVYDNAVAFRSVATGKYLTVYGPMGKLVAMKGSVGKDELFVLEQSAAQCVLVANNEKKVSHRQGVDLTANQFMEPEDTETFQLGYHPGNSNNNNNMVTFRSRDNKYWQVDGKGVKVHAPTSSPDSCHFQLQWHDNKVSITTHDGKLLKITSGGTVQPSADGTTDPTSLYLFQLANRHILVLRGEHGYIGMASGGNKILCNKGNHDSMLVQQVDEGYYQLRASNGRFWVVDDDDVLTTGDVGSLFVFELCGQSKMMIRLKGGRVLQGDNNGTVKATGESENRNTVWEF